MRALVRLVVLVAVLLSSVALSPLASADDTAPSGSATPNGGATLSGSETPSTAATGTPTPTAPGTAQSDAVVPVTLETGVKKLFCGPESFTPDLQPCVGEAPELARYFVAVPVLCNVSPSSLLSG